MAVGVQLAFGLYFGRVTGYFVVWFGLCLCLTMFCF